MAIALEDVATNNATATSLSATFPGGAPDEFDVLTVAFANNVVNEEHEPTDGRAWRRIRRIPATGFGFTAFVYVCGAGESDTVSFHRIDNTSDDLVINAQRWSGCEPGNPVFGLSNEAIQSANTALTVTGVNTELDNSVIVAYLALDGSATVSSPPATYTLAAEIDGLNPGLSCYYKAQASAGATGNQAWTVSASVALKGFLFALRPASGWSHAKTIVGSAVNTDNAGGNAWSNPSNATSETFAGGNDAEVTVNGTAATDYLDCTTNASIGVPVGATLKGYEVLLIDRERTGGTTGNCRDNTIQPLIAGSATGSNKALTTSWPITNPVSLLYGHPNDLWTLTPTVADANSSTTGVRIALQGAAAGADRVGNIDAVEVTWYYEPAAGGLSIPVAWHHHHRNM